MKNLWKEAGLLPLALLILLFLLLQSWCQTAHQKYIHDSRVNVGSKMGSKR